MELEKRNDEKKPFDVFISYRRETGADDARLLQQALKARGYNVFFDYDSLRDGKFDETIFEAIDEAPVFVLMLTERALDRCVNENDWVRLEIERAINKGNIKKGKKIISVAPSDQKWSFPEHMPDSLSVVKAHQASELNKASLFDESIDKIIEERFPLPLKQKVRKGTMPMMERIARTTTIITLPGGAEIEMTYCPPGGFMMGSPTTEEARCDDEDQHHVRLTKGFWLGRAPVTQGQWQSVMGSNPSKFIGDKLLPVDSVSWNDCREFIGKVASAVRLQLDGEARFPTEAEWEYACRAGTTTAYNWGECLKGDKANCNGNYPYGVKEIGANFKKTTPVGCYGENAWGLCDLHGNVWEWCADWYGEYAGDAIDPTGPDSGTARVLRGGSWCSHAQECRSARRSKGGADKARDRYGFRLCCSASI